jgi:hypothetical protein
VPKGRHLGVADLMPVVLQPAIRIRAGACPHQRQLASFGAHPVSLLPSILICFWVQRGASPEASAKSKWARIESDKRDTFNMEIVP